MATGAGISIQLLLDAGVRLDPGLTGAELREIESRFGFTFDFDHRELLILGLPVGHGWPDWRNGPPEDLQRRLDWPVEGIIWDVHNNDFWPKSWGHRPSKPDRAERKARTKMARVPRLIPVWGHRFMAAGPSEGSAPVFSVMQADVVYYGDNLPSYIAKELDLKRAFGTGVHRHIPFWASLAEGDANFLDWPKGEARAFRNISIEGDTALRPDPDAPPDAPPVTWRVLEVDDRAEAEDLARRNGWTMRDE